MRPANSECAAVNGGRGATVAARMSFFGEATMVWLRLASSGVGDLADFLDDTDRRNFVSIVIEDLLLAEAATGVELERAGRAASVLGRAELASLSEARGSDLGEADNRVAVLYFAPLNFLFHQLSEGSAAVASSLASLLWLLR
ncbi:hypothetical protein GGH92_006512, partial [Coemansia sp. RSA 2673]